MTVSYAIRTYYPKLTHSASHDESAGDHREPLGHRLDWASLAAPGGALAAGTDRHRRCAQDLPRGALRSDRPEMRDRLLPRQDRAGKLRAVHRRAFPQGARRLPLGNVRHGPWRLAHRGG